LAQSGKSNAEISAATSIPQSYIGYILAGHEHWIEVTKEQFAALGQSYPEKFTRPKPEKPAAKKEAEVKA
jgi:hypothetical protein